MVKARDAQQVAARTRAQAEALIRQWRLTDHIEPCAQPHPQENHPVSCTHPALHTHPHRNHPTGVAW